MSERLRNVERLLGETRTILDAIWLHYAGDAIGAAILRRIRQNVLDAHMLLNKELQECGCKNPSEQEG